MTGRSMIAVLAAAVVAGSAGCGGGEARSEQAFCEQVAALADADPFAELAVASPGEMRVAFDTLAEGAERITEVAPDAHRRAAETYLDTVEELVDQLRGAGFDPREVDPLAYRSATSDYQRAAIEVETAARNCP